jgi:predicted GNAT family acetyltransferase
VRFSGALRQEKTSTSVTQLDQRSLVWFAKAEYTRRLFGVALEYRLNSQRLQFDQAPVPAEFRGRQFNLRLLRKFGRRM